MKDCLKQWLGVSILAQLSTAEQSTGLMSLGRLMITFSARQSLLQLVRKPPMVEITLLIKGNAILVHEEHRRGGSGILYHVGFTLCRSFKNAMAGPCVRRRKDRL